MIFFNKNVGATAKIIFYRNFMITSNNLKPAYVSQLFKRHNSFDKANYSPLRLLLCSSKTKGCT